MVSHNQRLGDDEADLYYPLYIDNRKLSSAIARKDLPLLAYFLSLSANSTHRNSVCTRPPGAPLPITAQGQHLLAEGGGPLLRPT